MCSEVCLSVTVHVEHLLVCSYKSKLPQLPAARRVLRTRADWISSWIDELTVEIHSKLPRPLPHSCTVPAEVESAAAVSECKCLPPSAAGSDSVLGVLTVQKLCLSQGVLSLPWLWREGSLKKESHWSFLFSFFFLKLSGSSLFVWRDGKLVWKWERMSTKCWFWCSLTLRLWRAIYLLTSGIHNEC